jgi:hypothetical protein
MARKLTKPGRLPKPRKLKVYRTSTGFHDAYVAAPSRAAALRAWGSENDLFARGAAEEIDDPALTAEPLAHPGTVIRKSRGSLAEQLAALPDDPPPRTPGGDDDDLPARRGKARTRSADDPPAATPTPPPKPPKPKPRPSRAQLDRAEAAAKALDGEQKAERDALLEREAALRRERRALDTTHAKARDKAAAAVDKAKSAYDAAVGRWRSAS